MERLWNEERDRGSNVLRQATLAELGGAGAIVREHLDRALDVLDDDAQDAAARMFEHLVTPSGTKIAHRASDLAQFARLPPTAVAPVLGALGRERILRPLDDVEGDRYEIFHDVLADAILDWRRRRDLEQERAAGRRRQRRLLGVAAAAAAALVVVAAIAIFALTQRTRAEDQARDARAREFAARALLLQAVDPSRSLALALRAARLDPSQQTEDVLRSSLLASHARSVLTVGSPVASVDIRPDGRRIATASADGRVRIWTSAGRLTRMADAHGPATRVAYDPTGARLLVVHGGSASVLEAGRRTDISHGGTVDATWIQGGTAIITAGRDGVAIRRARDGALRRDFPASGPAVRAVLSRDGTRVAAVGSDGHDHVVASLYDAKSGRLLRALPRHGVGDVEFSPDSRLIAVASADDTTTLWRARDGLLLRTLVCGANVNDIAFSPDGALLAAALANGGVRVWARADGEAQFELVHFFLGHTNPALHVTWSPNGRYVVSTSADRTARVRQPVGVPQGETAVLAGHRDAVETAVFARDGRSIVTAAADGTARVWDAAFEQRLVRIGSHNGAAHTAVFANGGRRAVSAGDDGTARVWDVPRRRLLAVLRHPDEVRLAVVSRDGGRIVTASRRAARIWTGRGRSVATLPNRGPVVALAVSPEGSRAVTAVADGTVALWGRNGRPLGKRRVGSRVTDIAITPDDRRLVTTHVDGRTRIWSTDPLRMRRVLRDHHGATVAVAIDPRGETMATAGVDATARVWSMNGRLLRTLTGHSGPLIDVGFDATGARLLTTSQDSDARLWDLRSRRKSLLLRGTSGAVNAGDISPDGRWVVTGGSIAAALWSAATGRALAYVRPDTPTRITDVHFSPSGRLILASGDDGAIRLYRCEVCGDIGDLESLAEARLARGRPLRRSAGG
jgi:WD40 repeat protein